MDFCTLINKKIYKYIFYNCHFKIGFNKSLNENLISLRKQGIIIDLQKIQITDNKCFAKIYVVGQYSNMDQIFNNYEDIINNSMYDLIMIN